MNFLTFFLLIGAFAATAFGLKNDICGLAHSQNGDGFMTCLAFIPKFSYNSAANECVHFIYGGCGGNENRFSSKSECEETCKEKIK